MKYISIVELIETDFHGYFMSDNMMITSFSARSISDRFVLQQAVSSAAVVLGPLPHALFGL